MGCLRGAEITACGNPTAAQALSTEGKGKKSSVGFLLVISLARQEFAADGGKSWLLSLEWDEGLELSFPISSLWQ